MNIKEAHDMMYDACRFFEQVKQVCDSDKSKNVDIEFSLMSSPMIICLSLSDLKYGAKTCSECTNNAMALCLFGKCFIQFYENFGELEFFKESKCVISNTHCFCEHRISTLPYLKLYVYKEVSKLVSISTLDIDATIENNKHIIRNTIN